MSQKPKTWVQYDKTLPYIEDRDPSKKPYSHLVKDGENSYKVEEGRRPSKMLLVNKLRKEVDKWRDEDYPGITDTTRELLYFWFFNDHRVDSELFRFWFCQREAVETLIYLFEVKKYNDLEPVVKTYSENFRKDLFYNAVELRYAFKMATGSGKTYAMALIIVWSYFNNLREKIKRFPNNFFIIAPNIIVYERLAEDFVHKNIFYTLPLIPPSWRSLWNIKITPRNDDSPLNQSGNLIVNNIQQLYVAKKANKVFPVNVVDDILGMKPQKDLTKSPELLLDKIKKLDNIMVINDEAHHVHDTELEWNKTLMSIHESIGINLWLDFSATPKTQTGTYYPWIIVDYPLAQAVEDRIVKAPLIVHRIDKNDPENITTQNVIQKYGDWIDAALNRWKEHYDVYTKVGVKPVLFIMTEKNDYADKITETIRKMKNLGFNNPEEEVMVIHVKTREEGTAETEIKISEKELINLRKLAREIDEKDNKVKIIVSNMMLREGWDVQNVTVVLGLRPFTSNAQILPEQTVGRGLRLIKKISPDHTQTLEVMGTSAFEQFVKELEKEGVGINTVKEPPPLSQTIAPEKSRLIYDIKIPITEFRHKRNYRKIDDFDPLNVNSIYSSDKLEEERKIILRMVFPMTETDIGTVEMPSSSLISGREIAIHITNEVMKRARLTCDFYTLYPKVEIYLLKKCFETELNNIEDEKLKKCLSDITVQEAIVDLLSKEIGRLTVESKEEVFKQGEFKLSQIEPFTWRRKRIRCKKTVFNFVTVYNDFEADFAKLLDKSEEIEKFAALANNFSIDYFSSRGAIRFYFPDFVAVQKVNNKKINWIIETKGREYEDTDKKDAAIKKWCEDMTNQTKQEWRYLKVMQSMFNSLKPRTFSEILKAID